MPGLCKYGHNICGFLSYSVLCTLPSGGYVGFLSDSVLSPVVAIYVGS